VTILVAGGTGTLGTLLVRRLSDRGVAVRVLTRDPARAKHLGGRAVEVVRGDVRDAASLPPALEGIDLVVSAVHGFAGPGGVSPASVDRRGNVNLIDAAMQVGAAVVLMSVVGAAPDSAIDLFRAKHDAEQHLRQSGLRWTILRSTAFIETWAGVMGTPLRTTGKTTVFGRGDNPINFVSAIDVAALLEIAVLDPDLRGQTIELGGSRNLTFNQVVPMLEQVVGRRGSVRHIPRGMLRAMAIVMSKVKPELARQARAALVMDTHEMSFDAAPTRRTFSSLPDTHLATALESYFDTNDQKSDTGV
jgi:uncharacterized protein YbjT (DUF2867 family)